MTATYDTATDIGKVRLHIGDTDVTPASDAIFTDEELQVFLDTEGSVQSAAAMALDAIASSSARLARLLRTMNWSEDTRGVAEELRKQAQAFRDSEAGAFGYAEQAVTPENARTIIVNRLLRDSA